MRWERRLTGQNISDQKAAHVFEKHFKLDVEELIISQSAIRRVQIKHREAFAAEVKVAFKPLILHTGMVRSWKMHRSWKRAIRPPTHYCLWTKRCKTVICTKIHDSTAVTIANKISQAIDD